MDMLKICSQTVHATSCLLLHLVSARQSTSYGHVSVSPQLHAAHKQDRRCTLCSVALLNLKKEKL